MATTAATQASTMRRLLLAAGTGDRDAMADLVTADVTGWSPNLFVTSRDDLLAALERREDTFSGIEVQGLDEVGRAEAHGARRGPPIHGGGAGDGCARGPDPPGGVLRHA